MAPGAQRWLQFTVPRWFAERGGWTADGAVDLFERYVRATAPVIGTGVRHVCTINEPNMIAVAGAIRELGTEAPPPTAGLPLPDKATTDALIEAHHRATAAVRAISADIQAGWSIATDDDSRRVDYTTGALQEVTAALEDGLDVRGYLHWSALDNYEWGSYRPTFGLISVDPDTFERTPRPSAAWLGGLARSGVLPRARA